MLDSIIKAFAGLIGLFLIVTGIQWQIDAEGSAAGLGMELLDNVGRSTQIGDFSAFFFVGGLFALLGLFTARPILLYTPAALLGFAAAFRTGAFLFAGAPFVAQFIVLEIVMCVVFITAALRLSRAAQS